MSGGLISYYFHDLRVENFSASFTSAWETPLSFSSSERKKNSQYCVASAGIKQKNSIPVKACPELHIFAFFYTEVKIMPVRKKKDTTSAEECPLFTNADIYSKRWQQVNRRVRGPQKQGTHT